MEFTKKQCNAIEKLLNTLNAEKATTLYRKLGILEETDLIQNFTEDALSFWINELTKKEYCVSITLYPEEQDFLIIRVKPLAKVGYIQGIGNSVDSWYKRFNKYAIENIAKSDDVTSILRSLCEYALPYLVDDKDVKEAIKEVLKMINKTRVTISFDYKGCSNDLQKEIDAFTEIIGLDNKDVYDNVVFKFVQE